jgi:hypothetical protein
LLVAVERRREVLLAVLGPLYRVAQALGSDGDERLFAADDALQPEASADIGRHHADALLREI